ncbi:hypothetical protein ES332_D05G318000v1 [Gossypium tomentosum]|uniref:F-box domain-containing protein n=1 Tax=Gossypium tomentosum TaxID=34277 RepID=A0A5D2L1S4_GOSTO|nr:hypothetical protein ES332_D05G318000v1 [Gossypium tomentosum]
MSERVRQKCSHSEEKYQTNISLETLDSGCLNSATVCGVDWTTLPDDTVIQLFSYLNYRDRASLASTCRTFRLLGSLPCLWGSLDLRSYKFDTVATVSLSLRCKNLQRLKFPAAGSADAIVSLQARELREISGDFWRDITDAALSVFVISSLSTPLSNTGSAVYQEVHDKVRDAVIALIDKEREGEQIDRALLKNVLGIFVEIGMGQMDRYEDDFEEAMLQDTLLPRFP